MGRIITNQLPFSGITDHEQLLVNLHPDSPVEQLTYGFLGINESLEEVIEKDLKTLEKLEITHDEIATTIEDVFLHMPKSINGNRLHLFSYIHSPCCPWEDFCAVSPFDYSEKVTEIWLCNPKHYFKLRILLRLWNRGRRLKKLARLVADNWVMVLSDLHPHLIRDHHFCEGYSTPYRIDPERFVRFMGRGNIAPYGSK